MTITGTVRNGTVVPDAGQQLPEGARVEMKLVDGDDFEWTEAEAASLPPDHPMAPYNREVELAILRESIESVKNGEPGRPLRDVFEELSKKYGLGPLPPE